MKNLITYLKALWSSMGNLQSSDVSLDRRLTVGSPSGFTINWTLKLVSVLVLVLTIGIGNAWGVLSSPYTCTFTAGMSMSGSNCTTGDVTWTVSTTTGKGSPSITFGNQNTQSCIKFGSGKNNYYSQMTLTTSAFSAYNVSSVVIYASSNNGGSKTFKVTQGATQIGTGSQSFSSTTWVTNITRNTTAGSGGDLSIEISSDATATFIHSIKVTYSVPSCSVTPTVGSSLTSVSATVNSITATVPISAIGGCNITENGLVYSTSVATPTVGASNCTKVTTTACGSTAANKEVTITGLTCGTSYYVRGYATNNAGTSYTNVKTQSTSACPKYTVTYNAGTGACGTSTWTQTTVGESTTLPSASPSAGCSADDWSFAGWCTTSAGSADDNTTKPGTILTSGSSYTPTSNVTLYAIYTKSGGGTDSYTLVSDAASFEDGTYVVAALSSSTYYFMDGNATADGLGVETTGLASSNVTDGSFDATSLPSGAIEIEVADDEEPDGDDHYYFIWYTDGNDTYSWSDEGTNKSLTWTTDDEVYTYHPDFDANDATDGCVLTSGSGAIVSHNTGVSNKASLIRCYASSTYTDIYFFKKTSSTNYMTSLVCSSALGAIDGTLSMSSSTDGTVTISDWTYAAGSTGTTETNVSSYTVKLYKYNSGTSTWALANANTTTGGSSGSQATRTGIATNSKSVTYTGLEYGETYKFTVQPIGDGSTYGNGTETAVTSINGNSLTDNKFLNKYSICIDDGTDNNYAHNYISSISSHSGSVSIMLNGGTDYYQYKLSLGGVIWWGNTGKMTSANCTGWTFSTSDPNCKLQTAMAGTYTFTLAAGTPAISVTYPSANQASGYKIYFDNSVLNWSNLYYRIGRGDHNQNSTMTLVTGTDNFYYVETPTYDNMAAWHIANNVSWSGSNSIYKTKTGDSYAITNAISFQPYVVTGDITIVPTTTHSTGGDDQNNNCEFYTINTPTSGMLTHTATVTAPTNGTITLTYTSKIGSPSTSTVSDLPHRTNLVITTTPATGYDRNTLTVNGAAFTSGNTHVLSADATIAATFTAKTYSITLDREGGTTGSTSVTMTYNSSSHTSITAPTKAGYEFAGWWSGDDGTGSMVMNAIGVLQANVDGFTGAGGIWTKDATCTLYAKWTPIKTFVPVTSSTTLEEGDEIIFYGSSNFMSTTQNSNNRGYTTTGYTASGSNYLIPSGSTVQIAKLEATEEDGEWLFNVGTNAYLHATTGNSNYLRTDVLASVGENGIWTIAVDGSNNATITSKGTSKVLRYNSNSTIFSCYASGQTAPKLYYYRRTDPYATIAPESLNTTFTYAVGYGPSEAQALTIKGYNLTGSMTVACPSGYELSSTSATSGFSTSNVTLTKDAKNKVNATVYIRLAAGKSAGTYNQTLVISGGGITNVNVSLSGSVVAAPSGTAYVLLENEDDLFPDDHIVILDADGEYAMSTQASNNRTAVAAEDQFTALGRAVFVSGASVQNIVVESCDNEWLFKVGDNSYLYAGSSSANRLFSGTARDDGRWQITIDEGGIVTTSAPKSSNRSVMRYNYNNGTPMFNCYADATSCEDIKFYAKPSATANVCGSPSALTDFETTYGEGASDAQSFTVKGRNLTSDITVTAPTGYEVCLTEGGTYTASVTLTRTDGKVAPTTVYVRLKDEEAGTIEGNITIAATGATTRNIAVTGTVAPNPEITLTGDPLLVTSRNGMNIMAKNTLTLNIRGARAGQTVSISGTGLKFYKNDGTHYVDLSSTALTAPVTDQVVYVSYNPTSAGTGAVATPDITVTCDGGSETFSGKIKARNLPDAVAIVAKVNGVWQALPANISSASNPAPVQVSVATDGGVKKAYGAGTLAYKLWPVKTTNGSSDRFGTYSSPSALNAAMVRFAGNSNKGLWANDNKSTNTINNNAVITDVTSDVTAGYEWTITTTEVDGQFVYNLTSTHGSNTNDLRLYSNKWGTYGISSGTNELYILPLVEVQDAALTVMEWSTNEMAVSYPNGGSVTSGTFKAMIGEGDKTTVTATSLGGDMYKLTGVGDLQANPGKVLTLSMTESSIAKQAVFTIPLIVTAEKTEAELRSSIGGSAAEYNAIAKHTDVVIREGGKMTTGTSSGNFNDLYIYPGGQAVVSNDMSFGTVYMRGGYSFLNYADKEYGYPDLCVKSGTITTSGVKYDLYIDNRYYYTFAMPYDVTLASVTDETGSEDFPVWVKHYNGETRASGTHVSGWEWYGDEPGQGSFFAGIGYEITAKPRVSGRPVAIIRFPVKSGNITTDAAREIGVSVSNYGYDDYGSGSLSANNVGWNFVGNPYLTEYKAGTASPGNANDTLMLVDQGYEKHIDETTGVWDGTYDWKSSNKRFITVPYDTQTDYHSEYVATYTIPAFSAFFIQTTFSGTFYMRGSRPQAAGVAPRFGQAAKEKPELHIDVLLSGEGESVEGKAGLLIHDKYEGGLKDFEDVEQWFVDQNEQKTYTFASGTALAYNLLNEQAAVQVIPMGYIATVVGEHVYSISESNDVSRLAQLLLTDYETGLTTDLLVHDYVFTTEAGRFDERFAISAVLEKDEVVTEVAGTSSDSWTKTIGVYRDGNTLTLRGLPEGSSAYVYDMTGKLIASRQHLHNVASFNIATQGVYNIRVVDGERAVTLRSVLH